MSLSGSVAQDSLAAAGVPGLQGVGPGPAAGMTPVGQSATPALMPSLSYGSRSGTGAPAPARVLGTLYEQEGSGLMVGVVLLPSRAAPRCPVACQEWFRRGKDEGAQGEGGRGREPRPMWLVFS